MTLAAVAPADLERVRKISQELVLTEWATRCERAYPNCKQAWNGTIGKVAQPDDPVASRRMYDERNPVARWTGPPVRWMQIACGWALMAICFATLYDIVARRLFAHSVQGVTELGAYLLAIVSAFGFSSALLQKAHSRVDFLFPRMPPLMVSVLNLAAAVLLFGLAAISVWQGWHVLDESLLFDSRANTPLQTPMWIPQGLWLTGLAVFAGVTVRLRGSRRRSCS